MFNYFKPKAKQLIICFSSTARVAFNPALKKILLFQYSYCPYISNFQIILPVICHR